MQNYEKPTIKPLNIAIPSKSLFGSCHDTNYDIEGHPTEKLVQDFGSPLFVFSENKIRKNIKKAKQIFSTTYPDVQFAWSYKTNYLDKICNIMHQEGSWAEVVSGFEYEKAIRNGVAGGNIIFNGPNKSDHDLLIAAKNTSFIHIDNFEELERLNKICNENDIKANIAIRVNMKINDSQSWDRFGFNLENGEAINALSIIAKSTKLRLKGLHCHLGTFIQDATVYEKAAKKMSSLALETKNKFDIDIDYIDMGGGFASKNTLRGSFLESPILSEYAESIANGLTECKLKNGNTPKLILECGRYLIDDTCELLSSVIATRRSAEGRKQIIIDAGVNTLFTAFWYDHKISMASKHGQMTEDVTIYGPLCMNIDVIRQYVTLPILQKGMTLMIHNVGAYNITQSMQFINTRPAVILIKEDSTIECIRRKETINDIESLEDTQ